MNLDIEFYWKLVLRRFPMMALLVTLCTGLGIVLALRTPEVYQTSARLLVEEPQIPDSMVRSTVNTGIIEQLDIIQQQIMTRANLIDIANRFNVYTDLREVEPDVIFSRMNANTRIIRSAGRNQATLLTIRFTGRNGRVVANVVNEFVTLVLEANSEFRIGTVGDTLRFFQQEVDRIGAELNEQSALIASFKTANSEALPDDQSYRLGRQSLMQERLSQLQRDLRTLQSQREDVAQIFENTGRIGFNSNPQQRQSSEQQQLLVARADLELALATYSAENPRVQRIQAIIDRLEAIVATQNESLVAMSAEQEQISPEEAMFQATMVDIDSRIDAVSTEIERTEEELESLQAAILASAANGIQLNTLQRDYQNIQTRYNLAVNNLNEAQMNERIETTSQGQRITVIESANIPSGPSGPNRPRIVILGTAIGIGLAAGFFVLLELLNRNIRRPVELVNKFGVTPIASIPYMESRKRRLIRRTGLVIGSLVAIVGVPLFLWYVDQTYMPLDLLVQRLFDRLGLS